jgi:hypothetical protein
MGLSDAKHLPVIWDGILFYFLPFPKCTVHSPETSAIFFTMWFFPKMHGGDYFSTLESSLETPVLRYPFVDVTREKGSDISAPGVRAVSEWLQEQIARFSAGLEGRS